MNLANIRDYLPRNYANIVASKTGKSVSLVYKVLAGHKQNIVVAEALIALAESHKQKINEIKIRTKAI